MCKFGEKMGKFGQKSGNVDYMSIILILNTIAKTINYNLDTKVTKKTSTPPPHEVFNWDSPYL